MPMNDADPVRADPQLATASAQLRASRAALLAWRAGRHREHGAFPRSTTLRVLLGHRATPAAPVALLVAGLRRAMIPLLGPWLLRKWLPRF
jgi:hypothetical protein